jgi:2-keto-4-pentenoate hydratase/2-oxohepta-3-ene-1,7-dioic acid hydratase in catechol pathway
LKKVKFENKEVIPSKVVCVGRNYVEHIEELNNEVPENMVLFCKVNSSISEELKFFTNKTRFEGEICFLVENNRLSGIGVGLDLTKADIQNYLKSKGLPWERAKAFDGSAVFSEFVELNGNIESIEMKLYLNDNLQQYATYELMIYKPKQILDEILSFMSLENGDIIMTGTPKGVTTYKVGDKIKMELFIDNKLVVKKEWIVSI